MVAHNSFDGIRKPRKRRIFFVQQYLTHSCIRTVDRQTHKTSVTALRDSNHSILFFTIEFGGFPIFLIWCDKSVVCPKPADALSLNVALNRQFWTDSNRNVKKN